MDTKEINRTIHTNYFPSKIHLCSPKDTLIDEEGIGTEFDEEKIFQWLETFQNENYDVRDEVAVYIKKALCSQYADFSSKSLRAKLFLAMKADHTNCLRHIVCNIIMQNIKDINWEDRFDEWKDRLEFFFECINSRNPHIMVASLKIYNLRFGTEDVKEDNTIPAAYATLSKEILTIRDYLQKCVLRRFPPDPAAQMVVQALENVVETINKRNTLFLLPLLSDYTTRSPMYCLPSLDSIFKKCMQILRDPNEENKWRHQALEIITIFSENQTEEICKISIKYIEEFVLHIVKIFTEVDDVEEFYELNNFNIKSNDKIAAWSLKRIMLQNAWKNKPMHRVSYQINKMLINNDWKVRHAALLGITIILDGVSEESVLPEFWLGEIMSAVIKNVAHSHYLVRHTAVFALGKMSAVKYSTNNSLRDEFCCRMTNSLMRLVTDRKHIVQVRALNVFCVSNKDHSLFTSYADIIMNTFLKLLSEEYTNFTENDSLLVLKGVISAVASFSVDIPETNLLRYYDEIMHYLKYIIHNCCKTQDLEQFGYRTVECASRIVSGVGGEKSKQDSCEIMDAVCNSFKIDVSVLSESDLSYLLISCNAFYSTLGKDFEKYLPFVMDLVFKVASITLETSSLCENPYVNLAQWHTSFVELSEVYGENNLGHKDIMMAFKMMQNFSDEFQKTFAEQYIDKAFDQVLFNLSSSCKEVKIAVATSLPYLFKCAKVKSDEYFSQKQSAVTLRLLQTLTKEKDNSVIDTLLCDTLNQCGIE